jgi:hypothetical protein
MMALSENCIDRLENWKFDQARKCLDESEPTDTERELVEALAAVFGNSGWLFGQIEIIVGAAVGTLIGDGEEEGAQS